MPAGIGVGDYHSKRAPDTGDQVNRNGTNDIVDLQAIQKRNREDNNHTADTANDRRRTKRGRQRPLTPSLGAATIIGGIGGVIVVLAVPLLDRLKIDDVVGAIPVHLIAGIWGTLAVVITNPDASWHRGW